MTEREFEVIYFIYKNRIESMEQIVIGLKKSYYEISKIIEGLQNKAYLSGLKITKQGKEILDEYKVDNAIIMAAGFSSRSMPLSQVLPKGLFVVRGEVLIERQIEQIKEAGIEEIVIVTGYKAEQYTYLADKYEGIILVNNAEYSTRNNLSSIYAARKYMRNSYICCSDNYFGRNVYESHVYDSYYGCKYSDKYVNEDCVVEVENGYIRKIVSGESNCWYTIAEAYFNKKFSNIYVSKLEKEYWDEDVVSMRMDDFHIKHIQELDLRIKEYCDDDVMEFDYLREIMEFDPNFIEFCREKLEKEQLAELEKLHYANRMQYWFGDVDVSAKYKSVPTDQVEKRLHLNENWFMPSPKCKQILDDINFNRINLYDMTVEDELVKEIAQYENIDTEKVLIHNGSAEVIRVLFHMLLKKGDVVLLPSLTWGFYKSLVRRREAVNIEYMLNKGKDEFSFDVTDIQDKCKKYCPKLVVIVSPNNPTGNCMAQVEIEKLVSENPNTMFLLDLAYAGFSEDCELECSLLLEKYQNLICSKTFSKFWGLANIRMGYGLCNSEIKEILELDLPPFGFSTISKNVAKAALEDRKYYAKMKREVINTRDWFINELNNIKGVQAFKSQANFVYVRTEDVSQLLHIKKLIEEKGIKVRYVMQDDILEAIRITIAPKPIMETVLTCFQDVS